MNATCRLSYWPGVAWEREKGLRLHPTALETKSKIGLQLKCYLAMTSCLFIVDQNAPILFSNDSKSFTKFLENSTEMHQNK